jgi:hypothetical protein
VFGQLAEVPYLSRRFVLKKYLGLTDAEIAENEGMWEEENPESAVSTATQDAALAGSDLNTLGLTRPGEEDMTQVDTLTQQQAAEPVPGAEAPSPVGGTPTTAPGGTPSAT